MDIIEYILPIACSVSFMYSFYLCSHWLSCTVSKTYLQLLREEQIEWNVRILSTAHAIISIIGAFYCTVLDTGCRSSVAFGYSSTCDWVISFTLGYMIVDFGLLIRHYDQLGNTAILLHHVFSIIPFSFGRLYKQLYFYECWVLGTELSTPFVNVKWFIAEKVKHNSKYQMSTLELQNGIVLWISVLLCRIINLAMILDHMRLNIDNIFQTDPLVYGPVLFGTMMTTVLSYLWFLKITQGLLSTINQTSLYKED